MPIEEWAQGVHSNDLNMFSETGPIKHEPQLSIHICARTTSWLSMLNTLTLHIVIPYSSAVSCYLLNIVHLLDYRPSLQQPATHKEEQGKNRTNQLLPRYLLNIHYLPQHDLSYLGPRHRLQAGNVVVAAIRRHSYYIFNRGKRFTVLKHAHQFFLTG